MTYLTKTCRKEDNVNTAFMFVYSLLIASKRFSTGKRVEQRPQWKLK